MLEANSELPGQPIEYRVNGGPWQTYQAPVRVNGRVELRTRSYDRRRTSRIVEVGSI
jgi:hexosaminidase